MAQLDLVLTELRNANLSARGAKTSDMETNVGNCAMVIAHFAKHEKEFSQIAKILAAGADKATT